MNVSEMLGKKLLKGDFGMEIEVEGAGLPPYISDSWVVHNDGSLRGEAFEYVTARPYKIDKYPVLLKELNDAFKEAKSILDFSFRTSVHVHVNVLDLTREQVGNFIYLYYLYEELLTQYAGEDRIGNRFALGLRDAEGILDNVQSLFSLYPFRALPDAQVRYSALNLASLFKFGSLEIRSMRGTCDEEVLLFWLEILNKIKIASKAFEDPQDIFNNIQEEGLQKFSYELFGDKIRAAIFTNNWENEVFYNMSLLSLLPIIIKKQYNQYKREANEKVEIFINKVGDINVPRAYVDPVDIINRVVEQGINRPVEGL